MREGAEEGRYGELRGRERWGGGEGNLAGLIVLKTEK